MCNCKKQPEPTPTPVPQTPDELHAQEITKWNGGIEPTTKDEHND